MKRDRLIVRDTNTKEQGILLGIPISFILIILNNNETRLMINELISLERMIERKRNGFHSLLICDTAFEKTYTWANVALRSFLLTKT